MIYVANVKTYYKKCHPGLTGVYVGRRMPGRPGSPLGNPHKLVKGEDRKIAINRYRAWLTAQKEDSPAAQEIERLTEIARNGDLVLLCWCAPLECHADVIKGVIEWKLQLEKQTEKEEWNDGKSISI